MVIATLLLAATLGGTPPARCADPPRAADVLTLSKVPSRNVGTRDLLRLRLFGPQGAGNENDAPFTLSPDGRQVAMMLRRADPDTNSYCQSLVVVDLASGTLRVVDRGGALIRVVAAHGNVRAGFPSGFPSTITPAWSPDGRSIAYLKKVDGPAQVWTIPAAGGDALQITHEAQDVAAVAWSRDGRFLLFRTDRALTAALAAIDIESLSGWHYDDRAFPTNRAKPFPLPSDPTSLDYALDPATGSIRDATATERELLGKTDEASRDRVVAKGGSPATLHLSVVDPQAFASKHQLELVANGRTYRCTDDPCAKSHAFWLAEDARSVLLLARSGWGNGDETFYRWSPLQRRIDRLATTRDVLIGCRPSGARLLCAREDSTVPRQLAFVDPVTGDTRTIFNPNPDYDLIRAGKVERIDVSAENRGQAFADVMFPPDYEPGRRYPMVVVQYESRGFLSGGTNNEFPIAPLASAGMIVLSFQRPPDIIDTATPQPQTFSEAMKLNVDHWADRRNVHSALMAAVDLVIARGNVDTRHIGITGLSDGLATAAFALLNSDRFSTVALAGCCEEPIEAEVLQGPQFGGEMMTAGYPPFIKPDPDYWKDYSIAQNAGRVRAPILIQAADTEYLLSLPTVEALREAGIPVDLYVYPDEHHSKWQPAHRLAVWDRTLSWFKFWFDTPTVSGEPPVPPKEIARWRDWRAHWHPVSVAQP